MTNKEKDQQALNIVMELKTAKQETRDEWRRQALAEYPEDAAFIETAYNLACK